MINALRPSSSIVAYCKHQKLEKEKNSQLKEHMVASFRGVEEGEEKARSVPGNEANFISLS